MKHDNYISKHAMFLPRCSPFFWLLPNYLNFVSYCQLLNKISDKSPCYIFPSKVYCHLSAFFITFLVAICKHQFPLFNNYFSTQLYMISINLLLYWTFGRMEAHTPYVQQKLFTWFWHFHRVSLYQRKKGFLYKISLWYTIQFLSVLSLLNLCDQLGTSCGCASCRIFLLS